jgi:ornithine cyclodeaminase
VQPLKPYLRWAGADHIADRIIAMPCYMGGEQALAGLKWIGSRQHNPARFGLERASAVIVLNDAETNYPIALMEGGLISGMRTAAITAVATRHLARSGFTELACIGCGPIARMQMLTLLEQFPSIARLHLFDLSPAAADVLAATLAERFPHVAFTSAASAEAAVRAADVVVT